MFWPAPSASSSEQRYTFIQKQKNFLTGSHQMLFFEKILRSLSQNVLLNITRAYRCPMHCSSWSPPFFSTQLIQIFAGPSPPPCPRSSAFPTRLGSCVFLMCFETEASCAEEPLLLLLTTEKLRDRNHRTARTIHLILNQLYGLCVGGSWLEKKQATVTSASPTV